MQKRFEVPVIVAALLVIPAMALARAERDSAAFYAAEALNVVIWLVFVAELAAISYVTTCVGGAGYPNIPLSRLSLLLPPPIMPASLQAARVLRLLRLVRLGLVGGAVR